MNSKDYWKNRKEWDMFHYMEQADKKAEEISKLYQKASRYLILESDAIFERYQKKHHLSEAEARRLLNTLQDRSSLDELKKALRNGSSDKAKADLLAELEGPAYRARLERLEQLQNQMDSVMQKVYKQEKEIHTSHYVDLGSEAYYRSIFRIQQETGQGFSFGLVDPKTIERIINSKWSGKHYSERIWANTSALAQDLKEELLLNLITGRTERETAEMIADKFAVSASKARRLIRTESCHVSVQMDMEAYRECDIEKYQFLATLDLGTSEVCRKLDNKVFPVSEQCPGKNCPPMHPWCRSTTVCAATAEEMEGLKRRARNPVTGKNELVPANMSYEEWYGKNVKGRSDAELNEKMIENRSSDRRQYEKYRKELGGNVPKNLDSFQRMKYTDREKWESVKQEYQDASRYQKIIEKAGSLNIKGKPLKRIDRINLEEYVFKDIHINIERHHQVTKEMAQKFVNDSVAAYSRWNGDVTIYVSASGTSVINHKSKTVSTAYRSEEYDEKFNALLEVLKIDKVSADK